MQRIARTVLTAFCLAVVLAGTAGAEEGLPKKALARELRAAYDAFHQNAALKARAEQVSSNLKNRGEVDAVLKQMPLSPLEFLKIDMDVKRYEIIVPLFIQDLHVRWVALHEPRARRLYGDDKVDLLLSRWPAYTGEDILTGLKVMVDENRNAAATDSPAPIGYDGEIQIAVNPNNPNQIVAAANTWGTAGKQCDYDATQAVFYSNDGGATWSYTCAPSNNVFALGTCSGTVFGSDPALYWNDDNEVFLNYMLLCGTMSSTKYAMVVARSSNGGVTWVKQGIIKNSWGSTALEDKNFYAIDNTATSPFYGRHYTCWDRNNNEKFAYSTDNGVTWAEVDLPTPPLGNTEIGCEIAVQKNGTVHVIWNSLTCGADCTAERMFYARSTTGGTTWSAPVQVRSFNLVSFTDDAKPPAADERGIKSFGAIDVDNSGGACDGTLYATFNDWTAGGGAATDVWVTRSTTNGASWSAPVKVNDDGLANRTQFHPFLQVDQSNGAVVVVWHDTRNDANNRQVDYFAARSINCGQSFEANVKASQASTEFNNSGISYSNLNTAANPNGNPNQYGEYMGLDVRNGKAYMAWTDTRHFFPGSSTNTQKENVGFAIVDFAAPTCVPPAPPSGVAATANGATATSVSWTAPAGATSYNILRSTTYGGPYTQVGTSAVPSFSDTGLTCNTPYYYVVQAVGACTSKGSAQAAVTTDACAGGGRKVLTLSSSPALPIPDGNRVGVSNSIDVVNSMVITSVSVNASITHSYQGDLEVALIGPDNTTVILHNLTGGGTNNINTTYNITTRSAQTLTAFNGKDTAGAWKLRVRDLHAVDTGTLNSWSLTFNGYSTRAADTAIPDNDTTGITSTINMPVSGTVHSMRVRVDLTHSYKGDLEIDLIGPDNTQVTLHNRTGGSADDVKTVYPDLTVPAEALSAFTGKSIKGNWTLRVRDLEEAAAGTLSFWEIDFRIQ